ncbi:MAG TPA: hypothetical protein VHO70_01730 [Chitinispirillaceae bacterium]|nr:hypothetical protein [Chitinispirillaceae bacterium]
MGSLHKTIALLALATFPIFSAQSSLRPSKPTHYFYVPTAYLNNEYDLVISLHEISFTLPARLQLGMSLLDNVGRLNFGARYGIKDNLSIGAGMAWSFVQLPYGGHAIKHWASPRLGTFLAWGISKTSTFETCLVPQMQIGDHFSLGVDFALKATPSEVWSVIWEVGTSFDITDGEFWLNTDGGVRIHPPAIPYLNFDAGIDLVEENLNDYHPHVAPYFDVIFAIRTKH